MHSYTIFFIAVGLAMDAFAVSISSGITIKQLKLRHALKIAAFFGAFQALMPLLGWMSGRGIRGFIAGIDHWVAFGLLAAIGCKMIYESFRIGSIETRTDPLNLRVLLVLSVATSIDAFAVGMSLLLLNVPIIVPAAVIGTVTFVMCFAGVVIGDRIGHFFESKIEIAGGLILIAIGVRILLQHMAH